MAISEDDKEYLEDLRREQEYAFAAHRKGSSVPFGEGDMVARFFKGMDCPDQYTCDIVYVDRTTGQCVMSYDGADPANTNPYYGAMTDGDALARSGYDINEMIHKDRVRVSDAEIRREHCRESYDEDYYDPWYIRDENYDREDWSD